jgi:hypothetical protein
MKPARLDFDSTSVSTVTDRRLLTSNDDDDDVCV